MKAWQYITTFIAILCTSILLVTNILAAWGGTDAGVWRWVMLSISVAADLGLVGFLFAMVANHQQGNGTAVFLALIMWAICGSYTGVSSMRWLEGNFRSITEPLKIEAETRTGRNLVLDEQIKAEQAHLASSDATALSATTQMKRDSAKAESKASRERIGNLMQQRWPAVVEASPKASPSVEHAFIGYEWAFPLALLFASQVSWFVTYGSIGHGQPAARPTTSRPAASTSQPDEWSNERPASSTSQPPERPEKPFIINGGRCSTTSTTCSTTSSTNHRDQFRPVSTSSTNWPTILSTTRPTERPVATSQPLNQKETVQVGNVLMFVSTDDKIAEMIFNGISERKIAEALGVKRYAVQRVKRDRGIQPAIKR